MVNRVLEAKYSPQPKCSKSVVDAAMAQSLTNSHIETVRATVFNKYSNLLTTIKLRIQILN